MGWTEINKEDMNAFPDASSFDYKRFYKFAKKYGYTHYSGPPTRTNLETFLLTKKDEEFKAERGLPPHYANAVFLSGSKRHTLLICQPFMLSGNVMDDLEEWNNNGIYDVRIYDEGQCWYATDAKDICSIMITLNMINFRDALKTIGRIIGLHGKPPKEEFSEDEIRNMLKPLNMIEGMKADQRKIVSDLIKQIDRQLESGQISTTPFKKMREIIDEPKSYERER